MVETKDHFSRRLTGLERKHAKMGKYGVYTRVDKNGVVSLKAKRARIYFPAKGLLILAASFFVFKAFILSANGPDAYNDRLAMLESGTVVEVIGARLLQVDPLTQLIANQIGPLLR